MIVAVVQWVQLCECEGDLCNQDFTTAGQADSTTQGPGDTVQVDHIVTKLPNIPK